MFRITIKRIMSSLATTKIDDEVIEFMYNSMKENFGNPSSTHQFGRLAKARRGNRRKITTLKKAFNLTERSKLPKIPLSVTTSTSTVGLPLESNI